MNRLTECLNILNHFITDFETKQSNTSHLEKCILLTNKKTTLYNKKYDPSWIYDRFTRYPNKYIEEGIKKIFNLETDLEPNKCNCINVVLYVLCKTEKLMNKCTFFLSYLFCIFISLENISKVCPDWVYRLYLDISVFEYLNDIKNSDKYDSIFSNNKDSFYELCFNMLKSITEHPNCEIYIYLCESRINNPLKKGPIRSDRFFTFIDPSTNISICREADGIVSNMDCYNLKLLSEYNTNNATVIYIPSLLQNTHIKFNDNMQITITRKNNINIDFIHANWVSNYIKLKNRLFSELNSKYDYPESSSIVQLQAGYFGILLKIKPEYYKEKLDLVKRIINGNDIVKNNSIYATGFDEIFLYELFSPIVNYKTIKRDSKVAYKYNTIHCEKYLLYNFNKFKSINYNSVMNIYNTIMDSTINLEQAKLLKILDYNHMINIHLEQPFYGEKILFYKNINNKYLTIEPIDDNNNKINIFTNIINPETTNKYEIITSDIIKNLNNLEILFSDLFLYIAHSMIYLYDAYAYTKFPQIYGKKFIQHNVLDVIGNQGILIHVLFKKYGNMIEKYKKLYNMLFILMNISDKQNKINRLLYGKEKKAYYKKYLIKYNNL